MFFMFSVQAVCLFACPQAVVPEDGVYDVSHGRRGQCEECVFRRCISLPFTLLITFLASAKIWFYAHRRGYGDSFKIVDMPVWRLHCKALWNRIRSDSGLAHSSRGNAYPYRQLKDASKQVRLLRLLPAGHTNAPLRARLDVEDLDHVSEFDALSYVWNQPAAIDAPLSNIVINNHHEVPIKPNLFAALRELRNAGLARGLWVDSLCINQDDAREREEQVSLMTSIFSRATNTHIWLGEQKPGDERGIAVLNSWEVESLSLTDGDLVNWDRVSYLLWEPVGETKIFWPEHASENCDALKGILMKPYWTRQWIVQELILSRRAIIHCGNASCLWMTAARALDSIRIFMAVPASLLPELSDLVHSESFHRVIDLVRYYWRWHSYPAVLSRRCTLWRMTKPRYPSVFQLAADFPGKQATDSRDHVFGLLGLCSGNGILSDYAASAKEIYRRSVLHALAMNRDLFFLSLCEVRDDPEFACMASEGWPSWVPDLRRSASLRSDQRQYFASGTQQPITSLGASGNLLVHGLLLDRIRCCAYGASRIHSDDDKIRTSLIRTLLIDIVPQSPTDSEAIRIIGSYEKYMDDGERFGDALDIGMQYLRSRMKKQRPSVLFITMKNRPGIGPPHARTGDVVAVLFGARVPIVLRPYPKGRYRVVGDCREYPDPLCRATKSRVAKLIIIRSDGRVHVRRGTAKR